MVKLGLRFAKLERKLGEVERAREIYLHLAIFCNPDTEKDFWSVWEAFEVQHGDEDSYTDLER